VGSLEKGTLNLWMFAARYALPELEKLCQDTEPVLDLIKEKLLEPTYGVGYFLKQDIPLEAIDRVVKAITAKSVEREYSSRCILSGCRNSISSINNLLCDACRKQYT
jgi:hypothetical protein